MAFGEAPPCLIIVGICVTLLKKILFYREKERERGQAVGVAEGGADSQ